MDTATLITRCRQEAGLSQRRLAQLAGTSPAAISLYESGQRIPRVDTLTRIVAATGATLELSTTSRPPEIDLAENGRALAAVLGLADHLPRRSSDELTAPVFAELAA
ncbi:MAG: helix-turn-helix transcriptional regulator [Acidimicrobiia bacterium]|nr:helix-turn-helix transcriptional regulator [Acidimicrobiia bacterium]